MYIGGTDETALHHLAAELLDNAMDEAVAGDASSIEVTLEPDNWLTVRDNGAASRSTRIRNSKISVRLRSSSQPPFGRQVRRQGLRDLGRPARRRQSVVNALSERLQVEVARDRVPWKQGYARASRRQS